MKVGSLFEVKVEEKIEPVIKVADRSNEDKLAGEIGGYVVTPLIERVLDEFLEHYTDTFRTETDEVGVWISGYFGSGKSHLAKIMALLAENPVIRGVPAAGHFEARVPHSSRHDSIIRSLRRMDQARTEVLAFNLNTIQDPKKEDFAYLLLSQFYQARGYCANLTYARVIEAEIDRAGRLEELHRTIGELAGKPWAEVRRNPTFFLKFFYEAAARVAPEHFASADEVKKALALAEDGELVNVSFLVRECLNHLDRQDKLDPSRPHRLLWVLDETGQWIAADKDRLSSVQAFIEELGVAGRGRVMAIVTTHGDMSAIYAEAQALEAEMKKIAGRFWLTPALTTENIELVLEERLLKKTADGAAALRELFRSRGGTVCDLGELADTSQRMPECDEEAFVRYYPFFPYQIHLIPDIVKSLRSKGGHGEQMSGSTRTLLGIVQDVLRDGRRSYLDQELGVLVSFDEFYNNLEFSEIKPDVRTDIAKIVDRTAGTELTRSVAEVLYLIRELPYIPRTADNLARLLAGDVGQDLATARAAVQAELERLKAAQLVSQSGAEFEYLTGERRSFEEEVRTVEQELRKEDLTPRLFAQFVRSEKRDYYDDWLGSAELSYLSTRFPVSLVVDGRPVPPTAGAVTLDVTTPYGRLRRGKEDLVQLSLENPQAFYVLANLSPGLPNLLARYLAMQEVAASWKSNPQQSEEARALARERESTDLLKLRQQVVQGLVEGIRGSVLIFRGAEIPVPQRNGSTPKDALHALLGERLSAIYTRFDQVKHRVVDDQRAIQDALGGSGPRNQDAKALSLYDPGTGTLNEHGALVDGVLTHLRAEHQKGKKVLGSDLLAKFRDPEFGWDPNAVRVAVAALAREGKVEVSVEKRPIRNPADPELLNALRIRARFEKAEVAPAGEVDTVDVQKARQVMITLAGTMKIDETAPAISQAFAATAETAKAKADPVTIWASGAGLPLPTAFTDGLAAFDAITGYPSPALRVTEIVKQQERLLKGRDAVDLYAAFQKNSGAAFVTLKEFVTALEGLAAFTAEKPGIESCVSRFRTAMQERTVAEPLVWAELGKAQKAAELELKELMARWRAEATTALTHARQRLQEKGTSLGLGDGFVEETLKGFDPIETVLTGEASPSVLAGLPMQIATKERALAASLEAEYRRLHPEKPPRTVTKVRLVETGGRRQIRTVDEWTAVATKLDARVKALLEGGAEVELE